MAKALGVQLITVGKALGEYKMSAWIDELIPAIQKMGARVKSITGLKSIDEVVSLAKRETGPVIFAFKVTVKNAAGATEEILHSVIAFRRPAGGVRFADYGGKFVNTLDDLIKNLGIGTPVGKPELLQSAVSSAVIDGAWLTGTWASAMAKGAFVVLQGWAAIETPNGVEIATPVTRAAAVANGAVQHNVQNSSAPLLTPPPAAVIKGSFELHSQRRKGVARPALPSSSRTAGASAAPRVEYLTGVQFRLNALGFGSGPVDGVMGPLTRRATTRFQSEIPLLHVDGIPGPRTQRALASACGY